MEQRCLCLDHTDAFRSLNPAVPEAEIPATSLYLHNVLCDSSNKANKSLQLRLDCGHLSLRTKKEP